VRTETAQAEKLGIPSWNSPAVMQGWNG